MSKKDMLSSASPMFYSGRESLSPVGTFLIRPLKEEDDLQVTLFLRKQGYSPNEINEVDLRYIVFNEEYSIAGVFERSSVAFAAMQDGYTLIWMH